MTDKTTIFRYGQQLSLEVTADGTHRFLPCKLCYHRISCHRVSVCLSVRLFVCHKSELYKDG